jgi:hypothetical protein
MPIHLGDWFMDHLMTPKSVLDDKTSNGRKIGE